MAHIKRPERYLFENPIVGWQLTLDISGSDSI